MISVCIATFNGEKYILQQIESILKQIGVDDEIIISDDSSDDNTIILIKQLNDNRIKVYENQSFRNPVYNFEFAITRASGDVIFLSDQDDIWVENKLVIMTSEIRKGYDLVVSDCKIINDDFDVIVSSYFDFNNSGKGFFKNLFKNSYMGCCMAFNAKVKDLCLPFPDNLPMHDSYIGLKSELNFKVLFLKEVLLLHRIHSKNASSTATGKSNYSFFRKIIFRLALIKAVFEKSNHINV